MTTLRAAVGPLLIAASTVGAAWLLIWSFSFGGRAQESAGQPDAEPGVPRVDVASISRTLVPERKTRSSGPAGLDLVVAMPPVRRQ